MTKEDSRQILLKKWMDLVSEGDNATQAIYNAMSEYAKEMSIGFANFMVDGTYDNVSGDYDGIVSFDKPVDEIYELFLKSQNEKQ